MTVKRAWLAGLVIVCAGRSALAEEANVGAVANVGSTPPPAPAAAPVVGGNERFAAPNGQLGAGLTASPDQKLRVFGEMAFSRAAAYEDAGGASASTHMTGLSFLLGGGYKLTENLELEAMVPFAWGEYGYSTDIPLLGSQSGGDSSFALANLHLGVNYFAFRGPLRFKVGGALEYGPWTNDPSAATGIAMLMAHAAMGGESGGLWFPELFSIVTPARVEYAFPTVPLVLSGDVQLGLHIPTDGGDTNFSIQLSPGLGYYAKDTVLVGLRMPLTFVPTESGSDSAFVALQPYGRFDLGRGFLDASFMLNLDDPYGFSFDQMKVWALRVGGGASF